MSDTTRFADTPEPPYYVVVFSNQRTDAGGVDYAVAAQRMVELAAQQAGFLGVESVRDADGFGITLSYWDSEAAIVAWKNHVEHTLTREQGRREWYAQFITRVARVERAYGFARIDNDKKP